MCWRVQCVLLGATETTELSSKAQNKLQDFRVPEFKCHFSLQKFNENNERMWLLFYIYLERNCGLLPLCLCDVEHNSTRLIPQMRSLLLIFLQNHKNQCMAAAAEKVKPLHDNSWGNAVPGRGHCWAWRVFVSCRDGGEEAQCGLCWGQTRSRAHQDGLW